MIKKLTVGDVYQLITTEPKTINENAQKQEVINTILSEPHTTRSLYVTNSHGILRGIITIEEIINNIAIRTGHIPRDMSIKSARKLFVLSPFGTAGDMMRSPVKVTKESDLHTALKKMADNNLTELPVTDDEEKVIGELNAFTFLKCINFS